MKIFESNGIVTEEGKQWNDLCDLITDYIFDIQNGLNADPFYDPYNIVIKRSNISSYYKYKFHKNIEDTTIIPNWIGKFEIQLTEDLKSKGSFKNSSVNLENGKINFKIALKDYANRPADEFRETLSHEIRHAYTSWLELTNNYQSRTLDQKKLYKEVIGTLSDAKEKNNYNILNAIKSYSIDNIVLKDEIFTNIDEVANIISASLYYTDIDEIHSFLQEFAMSIRNLLKTNKEKIIKKIKESNNLKIDYNLLTKPQQWCSNILNNIDITNYSSQYFRIYKILDLFWTNIQKIDSETKQLAISQCSKSIKLYMHLPISKKLIKYDGDEDIIMNNLQENQQKIIKKVLIQMNKIFANIILNIELNNNKIEQKITNDINDIKIDI